MPTRPEVRQAILDLDEIDGLYGTATAGTVDSLTDTDLLQFTGQSVSRFANRWLYRSAANNGADVLRKIPVKGFRPDDGRVDHSGPSYTEAPLASTDDGTYEIWPFDPLIVNRAFSRALTLQCFRLQRDDIVTNGQTLYDVTVAPFSLAGLTSPANQILEINQVLGTDPNATVTPWKRGGRTYWPELDNDVLFIRFDPAPNGTIQIAWKFPYVDVTDETTDSPVDTEWVVQATLLELWTALRNGAKRRNEDATEFEELAQVAYARYYTRRKMFMDRFGAQVRVEPARWRTAVGSPSMGRRRGTRLGGAGGRTISPP